MHYVAMLQRHNYFSPIFTSSPHNISLCSMHASIIHILRIEKHVRWRRHHVAVLQRHNYFSSIFTSSPHNVSLSPPRLFLPLPLLSIFIKKIQKSRNFGLGVWKVFKTKKFTCLMYRDR